MLRVTTGVTNLSFNVHERLLTMWFGCLNIADGSWPAKFRHIYYLYKHWMDFKSQNNFLVSVAVTVVVMNIINDAIYRMLRVLRYVFDSIIKLVWDTLIHSQILTRTSTQNSVQIRCFCVPKWCFAGWKETFHIFGSTKYFVWICICIILYICYFNLAKTLNHCLRLDFFIIIFFSILTTIICIFI